MSGSSDEGYLVQAEWPWRVVLFTALAVMVLGLEQLVESWLMPSAATALGVNQLQPSDQAAERLRAFQLARNAMPIVAWGLIVVAGFATFVPLPRRWTQWLWRTFA